MTPPRRLTRTLLDFGSDEGGASAVEFALWLILLTVPTLNVVDMGFYIFKNMQVRQSAQAGAQAVESICGYNGFVPAATNCQSSTPALSTTQITNAMQRTSLGTNVTLSAATEGWYCNNTSGALVIAKDSTGTATATWNVVGGTAVTQPADCTKTITGDTDAPGDYVFVTASYNYTPMLPALSLLSVLRTSAAITQTGWMRIS
jgi:Flp pilus assembly protein TadG